MKIKRSEAAGLLEEWVAADRLKFTPIRPDEVSQQSYAELLGVSADTAARLLKGYVRAGTWEVRDALVSGKCGLAYRPKAGPNGKR